MIFHIATLLFVVLKATGYIAWSWWLVFAPSIIIITFGLATLIAVTYIAVEGKKR